MRKSWILLAALALALAGFAVFAIAQNSAAEAQDKATAAQDPLDASLFDQKVSVQFQDAPLSEVLRWLAGTGVNFVADPASAGDVKVTLNVKEVPLRDVLRALGQVFNGSWTKSGEVYAFKPKVRRPLESLRVPSTEALPFNREEWRKWMEEFRQKMPEWPDVTTPERLEEYLRKLRESLLPEIRRFEQLNPGQPRIFRFEAPNISRLFESITEEQWQKHEQQGYLTPNDLTAEQRAMLGGTAGGMFNITLNVNGRTLNIRSK